MLQFRSRNLVLYPALALIAPFVAGCDSSVAPEVDTVRDAWMCKTGPDGECIGTPAPTLETRLTFHSVDELKSYLALVQNATPEELIAYESSNGFESLRAYLDPMEDSESAAMTGAGSEEPTGNEARALENDGVTRDDFPVGDAFLSVLNNRGEIQVAGRVYKVTRDYVYEVAPADVPLLNQKVPTLSARPPAGDARITVRPVETTLTRESEVLTATAPTGDAVFHHVPGVGGNCYVYAGDRRMHGKSYISNFFFYGEAGVSTEWERRKKFLWWTTWSNTWQSGTLSHTYTGDLYEGLWNGPFSPIGPGTASQSQTGTSKVHKTLTWVVGFGMRIRGTIHTTHNVSNSNATGSCDTDA